MTTGGWTDVLWTLFGGFVQLQFFGLFVTGLLAVPVSFATLWLYRRQIVRSLESSEIVDDVPSSAPPDSGSPDGDEPMPVHISEDDAMEPAGARRELGADLGDDAWRHRRRLGLVYSLVGLALALVFAVGHGTVSDGRFWSVFILCSVAVGVNLLVVYGRWHPGPWFVGLLILAMFVFGDERVFPFAFLLQMVILLALLLHPRVRAMASMAMAFFGLVTTGTFAAIAATIYLYRGAILANVLADPRLIQFVEKVTSGDSPPTQARLWAAFWSVPANELRAFVMDHLGSLLRTIAGLSLLGILVSFVLGGLVFTMVAKSYSRKNTSALWLVIVSSWIVMAIASSHPERPFTMVTNLTAVAIAVVVVRAMWRRERRTDRPGVRLLLLRSFTLGRRSDRFFQELETLWRGIGSVQLIGGPDLAVSTLEPHELLDFLRGRAGRYFVHRRAEVEARLAGFDYERDPDGCFRVNDLYCVDAVWQYAVSRLLDRSDCVLMDLRGFNRHRAGCVFEIQRLAQSMPVSRVVFLVDKVTDRGFVEETWVGAAPVDSGARSDRAELLFVADRPRAGAVCGQVVAALSRSSAPASTSPLAQPL